MVKSLSIVIMGVHAAKTLSGNIWVRFNDYSLISVVKNDNRSTAQSQMEWVKSP
jgi:hypothetical protein